MSESKEQAEIVKYFRTRYPDHVLAIRVSQSGGFKGKGRAGAIRMAQAKAQGVVTGEADIAILLPRGDYGSLLIEHKKAGGTHKVTEAQQQYLDYHNKIGNMAVSTRGVGAAIAAIDVYMGYGDD